MASSDESVRFVGRATQTRIPLRLLRRGRALSPWVLRVVEGGVCAQDDDVFLSLNVA
ncbi:UNVERIFIED_CONTAM: hypothetical protein Slati_0175700 [Sesamum latifolium]|uniref:Uncharacterized protein n=1 Tax=Sesamum latifolium TaxID=2727402 RepID=A0AAW2YAF5_9LAMI